MLVELDNNKLLILIYDYIDKHSKNYRHRELLKSMYETYVIDSLFEDYDFSDVINRINNDINETRVIERKDTEDYAICYKALEKIENGEINYVCDKFHIESWKEFFNSRSKIIEICFLVRNEF